MEKNNNDIVKVIHIVGKMDMGGQETFIMNLYRNIDRNKIQFDFIVHSKEKNSWYSSCLNCCSQWFWYGPTPRYFKQSC